MERRLKIVFCWQGVSGRYGQWKDGLYAAMKIIEKTHEVKYFEPSDPDIESFNPDWILYWEAPVTCVGKDKANWDRIAAMPFKKALLFAGGEIQPMWVKDFDHLFLESQIDMDTCDRFGIPHSRAFGINENIFKPQKQPKVWDGMLQATCASWKRTWLMTGTLQGKSMVCGREQETDPKCFMLARDHGALVLPEQSPESVAALLNASVCVVNTSEFWGGGQRATLEAIACGIPVIVMSDSPKNCEFIRESGYGVICDPNEMSIKQAYKEIGAGNWDIQKSQDYIQKWSSQKYADAIMEILCQKYQ